MEGKVFGHDWAVNILVSHITREEVRHAYLFSGAEGVGRRTLALEFAKVLNCPVKKTSGVACDTCKTCISLKKMEHVDLSVIQADKIGGSIKVEQIRDLQHSLSLTPYEAKYRIALLLRFEEATQSAQNALLKMLEEPPPNVILLVTTNSLENILPTVASRCEVLRLRPMVVQKLTDMLVSDHKLNREQARQVAHLSGGRVGAALHLLEEPLTQEQNNSWLYEFNQLLKMDRCDRFSYVEGIHKDKEKVRMRFLTWLTYWRDVMILSSGSCAPLINLEWQGQIEKLASAIILENASQRVAALDRAIHLLDTTNVNPRLLTEVVLLDWPRLFGGK